MSPPGTIDAIVARLLDEALERKLQPIVAELAELRAGRGIPIPNDVDSFLKPEQVGSLLSVETQTINRWIRSGKLAAEGPSRARRVRRSVVERFMAAKADGNGKPDLDRLADAAMKRRRR